MDSEKLLDAALELLAVAVYETADRAAEEFQRMMDGVEHDQLLGVVISWCDTAIEASGTPHGEPVHLIWQDPDSGADTDQPPENRSIEWSGQLIAARCAMDWDSFRGLMMAIPKGQISSHLFYLLMVSAECVRTNLDNGKGKK